MGKEGLKKVLAVLLAGGIALTSSGAIAKEKGKGTSTKPATTIVLEDTKAIADQSIEEVLGAEQVAFLNKIGVQIVDNNLQLQTVEQVMAICDRFNDKLEKEGFPRIDAYTKLLRNNFIYLQENNPSLLFELIKKGIIDDKNIGKVRSAFLEGEKELWKNQNLRRMNYEGKIPCISEEDLFLYEQGIKMSHASYAIILSSNECAQSGDDKGQDKIIGNILDYYTGKTNHIFPYDIEELDPQLAPFMRFHFSMQIDSNIVFGKTNTKTTTKFDEMICELATPFDAISDEYSASIKDKYDDLAATKVNTLGK